MSVVLVVVAAGSGTRLAGQADGPKALVDVAGRPLLDHALERLCGEVDATVVVAPPDEVDRFADIARTRGVAATVGGGATRSASVRAGVAAAPPSDVLAIHDAARAFAPPEALRRAIAAVEDGAIAVAPALPVADTLKRVEGSAVVGTVERAGLYGVQTPQVFARPVLERVLAWAGEREATDELGLVEAARDAGEVDGRVEVVAGSLWAHKITYPDDLALAELIAGGGDG